MYSTNTVHIRVTSLTVSRILIAYESGESVTYVFYLSRQDRGTLFIGPGQKVYGGMVIGQNGKAEMTSVKCLQNQHLTNTRTSSADEALKISTT